MTPRSRVGIYALDLDPTTTSSLGIYNYTRQMIRALARQESDPGFNLVLLLSSANAPDLLPPRLPEWMGARVVHGRFGTGWRRLMADHVLGPWLFMQEHLAAVHFPKGWLPWRPLPGLRCVATLHDTIVVAYRDHYPHALPPMKLRYFVGRLRHALKTASLVITPSEYSRDRLATLALRRTLDRLVVIPEGPGLDPPSTRSASRSGILVLGSLLPHKATRKTLQLLDAYAKLASSSEPITVTGLSRWPASWGAPPIGLRVTFVGRVSNRELTDLLARSRALVLLSEIEGFGLPLLDAYQTGTPVCYRAATSLAEIMNGHPGGWDGASEATFCAAMDATLALREDQIRAIQENLRSRFNWADVAKRTLAMYERALTNPAGPYPSP